MTESSTSATDLIVDRARRIDECSSQLLSALHALPTLGPEFALAHEEMAEAAVTALIRYVGPAVFSRTVRSWMPASRS